MITHGDYCVPNIVFDRGRLSGFVDLGDLGVADRWHDLAVATWNLGPGWQNLFLRRCEDKQKIVPQAIAEYRTRSSVVLQRRRVRSR